MSKWLEFQKGIRPEGRKTDVYRVFNKSNNTTVGEITWYGGFRKYVFAPCDNMIFDASCLSDVSDFLLALMDERKIIKKNL